MQLVVLIAQKKCNEKEKLLEKGYKEHNMGNLSIIESNIVKAKDNKCIIKYINMI